MSCCDFHQILVPLQSETKNASHKMAIVRKPYNVDAYANIPALFKTMLCPLFNGCDCTVAGLPNMEGDGGTPPA